MTTSSSKLEREVEASRAQVEDTVEALREKMSVGDLVNEATRYFQESGGRDVIARLGEQIRDNPMPLVLVGVGLTWLMSGRGQPHLSQHRRDDWEDEGYLSEADDYRPRPVGGSSEEGSGVSTMDGVKQAASDAASAVSDATGSAADWARRQSRAARRRGRETYAAAGLWSAETYDQGRRYARSTYRSAERTFFDTLEREPLILGAIGVAVGAAIGAMLPRTDIEDRYLGEASAHIKEDAEPLHSH